MMENAPKIFFISILFIIITSVMSELQIRLPGSINSGENILDRVAAREPLGIGMIYTGFRPLGAALALVLIIIRPVVEIGYMGYCLKTTRGDIGDYKHILDGFALFGKTILISLIITALVLLWSLLFIFPGIVASYRYRQAYYVLLDSPEKSAVQCIKESKQLMSGSKLDLFLIDLGFIGWVIVDFLFVLLLRTPVAIPLVSIWLTPYMGLVRAEFYDRLLNRLVL